MAGRYAAEEHIVKARFVRTFWNAQACGRIALRIGIDDQNLYLTRGQRGTEVDGGGCLADPALLVSYGDYPAQVSSLS